MKFIQLDIQGFKSFTTKKTFKFPEKAGLYFLTGKNEIEPDLEANAAGKTTLWDAITWCLYNKTPRNKTAGDVKPWYSNEKMVVSLKFELKNTVYTLTRTWSPNSLELREHGNPGQGDIGRFVTQEELVGIIKLDFDQFLYSILFSQFRGQFFDLGQAAKTELFTQILNLEEWDGYSKKASQRVNQLESILHEIKLDTASLQGKVITLEELNFDKMIDDWEHQREMRIIDYNCQVTVAEADLEELRNKAKECEDKKKEFTGKTDDLDDELGKLKIELDAVLAEEKSLNDEIQDLNTKIGICKHSLTKYDKLGDKCPTCSQIVDPAHIEKELNKIRKKQDAHQVELDDLLEVRKELLGIKQEILDEKNEKYKKIQEIIAREAAILDKIKSLRSDVSKVMSSINQSKARIEKIQSEKNPHVAEKEENANKIKQFNMYIMQKVSEQLSLSGEIEQTTYWVKAFKNIRLFLISEVLTQLEVEVNNCLFRLGLRDWRIEFDIDKENKSGTVKKGFTILIYSPYNTVPVAWESWSGGETQRLKLAGTIGLSNLILARCGIDSYVETFDEPSNWLSQKGIDQLLETLDARSQELNKQIWLIDHRALDSGYFTGIYSVNKDKNGSYFETLQ